MNAALHAIAASGMAIPDGIEFNDLAGLAEEVNSAVAETDEAAQAVAGFVRQSLANAPAGGVAFTADDAAKLLAMLDLVAGRAAAALEACDTLTLAEYECVR